MKTALYVPILKFKLGEQNALVHLKDVTKQQIIPLLEIQEGTTPEQVQEKISTCWNDNLYYFDVTENLYPEYFDYLELCNREYVIPVLSLGDDIDTINSATELSSNGCAIRIYASNFTNLTVTLNELINQNLTPNNVDLLIDLKTLSADISEKIIILSAMLTQIPNISSFRSVIVSGTSFPENFNSVPTNGSNQFRRSEAQLYSYCSEQSTALNFEYIYSDYGISTADHVEPSQFMNPAFKIKYSTPEYYCCYKGLTNRNRGLNISNIQPLCRELVHSTYFSGSDFSYADAYIHNISSGNARTAGNNTTWVTIGQNHHIELITNLLSN